MKMKKIIAAAIAFLLFTAGLALNYGTADAAETYLIMDGDTDLVVIPGETTHIRLPIKAVGEYIILSDVLMEDLNTGSPFTLTKPVLKTEDEVTAYVISNSGTTYVDFDVTVNETAVIGNYPLTIVVHGRLNNDVGMEPQEIRLDFKLPILKEKASAQLTINNVSYMSSTIGSDTGISFTVKNEGEIKALNTYMSIDYTGTGVEKGYTTAKIKIGDLKPGEEYGAYLPVTILPTATAGKKNLPVKFEYKNIDGIGLSDTNNINFNVTESDDAPILDIADISYPDDLKPGDEFTLTAKIENFGDNTAEGITASVGGGTGSIDNFIKNYYSDEIEIDNIKAEGMLDVEIPLIVSDDASGNMNELIINIKYQDELGVLYSKVKTVYLKVESKTPDEVQNYNLIVDNVKQSPSQPKAGENMEVSFDIHNYGNLDIKELKINLVGLTGSTFIPVESEPYIYIEKLEPGATKNITFHLLLSDDIPEGLNNLTVGFVDAADPVTIPVLDVQNDMGSSSKPKLIVSKYAADIEELKAGSTFNFTFDIYNTHSSVNAKNITITVTQAEDIFTPTQGSNSFFIDRINAGETVQKAIELKVKTDAKTGTYKLKIDIEYEYDGIKPNPQTNEIGEKKSYDLNLRAVENARPVVDYVNVYSYEGMVTTGNPAMLSFEFYNMGKSALNNVIATVEGDFTKSDGNMYFIGNVMEGSSSYAEFEVIPNIEGTAKGVLKVTYEDSNGDEVVFNKEFETEIMGAQVFDPGMGGEGLEVINPMVPVTKKPILPTWMYIIINVVIFIAFIPITRKIIISVYRKKLRKKEEENL